MAESFKAHYSRMTEKELRVEALLFDLPLMKARGEREVEFLDRCPYLSDIAMLVARLPPQQRRVVESYCFARMRMLDIGYDMELDTRIIRQYRVLGIRKVTNWLITDNLWDMSASWYGSWVSRRFGRWDAERKTWRVWKMLNPDLIPY